MAPDKPIIDKSLFPSFCVCVFASHRRHTHTQTHRCGALAYFLPGQSRATVSLLPLAWFFFFLFLLWAQSENNLFELHRRLRPSEMSQTLALYIESLVLSSYSFVPCLFFSISLRVPWTDALTDGSSSSSSPFFKSLLRTLAACLWRRVFFFLFHFGSFFICCFCCKVRRTRAHH